MVSFDKDFSKAERDDVILLRGIFRDRVDGTTYTTTDLDNLRKLVVYLVHMSIDDVQMLAEDREFSRSLDGDGLPVAPEYRHEFLMSMDDEYRSAWAYDHVPDFVIAADADPTLMLMVTRGRASHPYREADPDIVDRSKVRHGYRPLAPGEAFPSPVIGRYAPRSSLSVPHISRVRVVPALT